MSIKIPYLRKGISSTSIALFAIALLLSSPLVLSNILLLQPVQAQTNLSFRTPTPASGTSHTTGAEVSLMFDAQGTSSSIDPQTAAITSGTMEITEDGQRAYSGNIQGGTYNNNTSGGILSAYGPIDQIGDTFYIDATCGTSVNNPISVDIQISGGGGTIHFNGPVECSSSSQGGNSTTQSSSSPGTTTTQDSDGDGIPDSSDRCTHNSNLRCFKEEAEPSTTTTQQEQPSTSSSSGNQTR
jgi:hypothetical protein